MNGITVRAWSKATNGAKALSTNFKVREFACTDGTDTVFVSDELVKILQAIRSHFGQPVTINSGYRTEVKNTEVGGSPKSQHKYGVAADIVVKGVTPLAVAKYAHSLMPSKGGVGLYKSFTHVDVRATKSRWDSTSGTEKAVSGF